MSEDIIQDFHKNSDMAVMILRYFDVIGLDPDGRLGKAPRPELREHGRILGACFDAARGITKGLKVQGTDYKTPDGTCIRDYINVTDLVDAHVKALENAKPGHVGIYNVGTGKDVGLAQVKFAVALISEITSPSYQTFRLKISLLAALPSCYGGLDGHVIYIDVESKFSSRRLIEIGINSFPEIFCLEGVAKEMAGRITVLRPASLTEFTESLQGIKVSVLQHQVKLLVIDSMAALVSGYF